MSDYSPPGSPNAFDDLEDLLYDADPAPDLADELAEHALYSPLLYAQDYEPGYELQEPVSDWEYYSDDYYDDDPDILRKYPIDGTIPGSTKENAHNTTRGKKRKLADVEEDSKLDDRRYLKACMQGTVWSTPVPTRDNHFRAGEGKKVALLKDWKARFGTASPKKNTSKARATPKLPEDESWANDLSLADMGLTSTRGSRVEQGAEGEADDEGYEGNEQGEDDIDEDEIEFDEEALALLKQAALEAAADHNTHIDDPGPKQAPGSARLTHRARTATPPASSNATQPLSMQPRDETSPPSKRRRKASPGTAEPLPTPPSSNTSVQPQRTTRARAGSAASTATSTAPATTTKPNSRKRKATSPVDNEDHEVTNTVATAPTTNGTSPNAKGGGAAGGSRATGPTASSRAKRAASAAHNVIEGKKGEVQGKGTGKAVSGPARATRSRK